MRHKIITIRPIFSRHARCCSGVLIPTMFKQELVIQHVINQQYIIHGPTGPGAIQSNEPALVSGCLSSLSLAKSGLPGGTRRILTPRRRKWIPLSTLSSFCPRIDLPRRSEVPRWKFIGGGALEPVTPYPLTPPPGPMKPAIPDPEGRAPC